MNATDQYLRRATRGLWGEKKRDTMTELRGAIEDKVYRHQLLGLNELEAEQAALRDLGSPQVIARELGQVHSGPVVLRAALLLGVTGLLGLQAAAQVPVVTAAPAQANCSFDEQTLAGYSADVTNNLRAFITRMGSPQQAEAACLASPVSGENVMLRLNDLLAALRRGGVEARVVPGTVAFVQLKLPDTNWQGLNLDESVVQRPGTDGRPKALISTQALIAQLKFVFKGPMSLTGSVNPVLRLGPATMQLGTAQAPVRTSNLLFNEIIKAVGFQLFDAWPDASRLTGSRFSRDDGDRPEHTRLRVGGPAGALYALVSTSRGQAEQTVKASVNGEVTLPCTCRAEIVSTPRALYDALLLGKAAVLVFRVDSRDLRNLTITPVSAAQIQLITAP